MKEIGYQDLSKGMGLTFFQMEKCMWVITEKENLVAMASTFGKMVLSILENSKVERNMGWGDGLGKVNNQIVMKDSIIKTRNMEKELSNGPMGCHIKEIISLIREQEKEKCTGLIKVYTMENG
jgi:hypothetical protein